MGITHTKEKQNKTNKIRPYCLVTVKAKFYWTSHANDNERKLFFSLSLLPLPIQWKYNKKWFLSYANFNQADDKKKMSDWIVMQCLSYSWWSGTVQVLSLTVKFITQLRGWSILFSELAWCLKQAKRPAMFQGKLKIELMVRKCLPSTKTGDNSLCAAMKMNVCYLWCYREMFLISWQMIAMLFCSSVHDWKLVKWYTLDGSLHLTQEKQTCLWEKTLGYFLIQLSIYLFITVLQSVTSQNT